MTDRDVRNAEPSKHEATDNEAQDVRKTRPDEQSVPDKTEEIDVVEAASQESFPASDSPGWISNRKERTD